MDQEHIDSLLERYLTLLDEYSRLRDRLSRLQSDVYHNIARANFSAERGLRYGQDQYDERMQASRLLGIEDCEGVPSFSIVDAAEDEDKSDEEEKGAKLVNPLRWFGLLAPMPLRNAQGLSVEAVEQVVPRLVSVNAEMLNLEIEVRRARKRRARTEQQKSKSGAAAAEGTATPEEAS